MADDGFEIRALSGTPTDMDSLMVVYRGCEDFLALGPVSTASMEMIAADLAHSAQEGGVFSGIFSARTGDVMGVVDYIPSGYGGDPHTAFLSLLMIAAPFRGQRLGERVVRTVENALRAGGQIATICSGVQVNNPGAIRFWQRLGYEIVSEAQLMPDTTMVYQLRKSLSDG